MKGQCFICLLLLLLSGFLLTGCIGGPKVFKALHDCPDAEFVRIPSLVARMAETRYGVRSVEVAKLGNSASRELVTKSVDCIVRDKKMDILVESPEDEAETTVYAVMSEGESPLIKKLLVVTREPGEISLVYIEGNIRLSDVIKEGKGDTGDVAGMFR